MQTNAVKSISNVAKSVELHAEINVPDVRVHVGDTIDLVSNVAGVLEFEKPEIVGLPVPTFPIVIGHNQLTAAKKGSTKYSLVGAVRSTTDCDPPAMRVMTNPNSIIVG